jgi:multidrug efflux pump subunit AcrA (membrane-fusion protein)
MEVIMNDKLKSILIVLLVLAGAIGGGYWFFTQNPARLTALQLKFGLISEAEASGIYSVSGYIEADETDLTAETKGRIAHLTADEGDYVEVGQVLVQLDTALLEAEVEQAQAQVNTAKAKLAKVEAGPAAEEIAKAEAAVAVAEAAANKSYVAWQNAITLRDNPQELEMQIDAARTQLELAELRIQQAIPLKDAGEEVWAAWHARWDWLQESHKKCRSHPVTGEKMCKSLEPTEAQRQDAGVAWNFSGAEMWDAWVDLNTAVTARDDAETQLNDLLQLKNDPQEAQVIVAQAQAAYRTSMAEVEVAQARLDALKAGARAEQIAVAQAQVKKSEAGLSALEVKQDKHVITAPRSGWVVEQTAHIGEMAIPGASLLTLADLTAVNLIVYVPEPDIDTVEIGQKVSVYVDAFPGVPFTGTVTYISNKAEFTPKNVQTKEERMLTVFAVKIRLDNEDQRLKPGMPADAVLSGQPEL